MCLLSAAPPLAAELGSLPSEALAAFVSHPDLRVRSENELFEFFTKTESVVNRRADPVAWWTFIRFEHLSTHCAATARSLLESISCSTALDAILRRREHNTAPRGAEIYSQEEAAAFMRGELRRITDTPAKHEKKVVVIKLFTHLVLNCDCLLAHQGFRDTVVNKVRQFMEDETEWRMQQVVAALSHEYGR